MISAEESSDCSSSSFGDVTGVGKFLPLPAFTFPVALPVVAWDLVRALRAILVLFGVRDRRCNEWILDGKLHLPGKGRQIGREICTNGLAGLLKYLFDAKMA